MNIGQFNDTHLNVTKTRDNIFEKIFNKLKNILFNNIFLSKNKIQKNSPNNTKERKKFNAIIDFKSISPRKKPSPKDVCNNTLKRLGFNFGSKGTKYIIDSIMYVYKNNLDDFYITTIYQLLSEAYSVPVKTIKWNISNAVKSVQKSVSEATLCDIFSAHDGRPLSFKYLIVLSVYELRKEFKPQKYAKKYSDKIIYSI